MERRVDLTVEELPSPKIDGTSDDIRDTVFVTNRVPPMSNFLDNLFIHLIPSFVLSRETFTKCVLS